MHTDTLYAAALAGMGITGLPSFVAEEALLENALERVLPRWHLLSTTIYAGMPTRKHVPARTRVFIDFLVETFGGEDRDPWLLAAGCETQLSEPVAKTGRKKEKAAPLPPPRTIGATGGGRPLHSSNTRTVQWAQMPRSSRSKIVAIAIRLAGKMWSVPSSADEADPLPELQHRRPRPVEVEVAAGGAARAQLGFATSRRRPGR